MKYFDTFQTFQKFLNVLLLFPHISLADNYGKEIRASNRPRRQRFKNIITFHYCDKVISRVRCDNHGVGGTVQSY